MSDNIADAIPFWNDWIIPEMRSDMSKPANPAPHPYKGGPNYYYCLDCGLPKSNWRHRTDSGPIPLSMRAEDALSFAILALNTNLDPTATDEADRERLDDDTTTEAALDALDRLRTFVRSITTT